MQLRKLLIQNACEQDNTDFEPISREQIIKTIKTLKNNKAADMSGSTAEHIKFGGDVLADCLTSVVIDSLSSGNIPDVF